MQPRQASQLNEHPHNLQRLPLLHNTRHIKILASLSNLVHRTIKLIAKPPLIRRSLCTQRATHGVIVESDKHSIGVTLRENFSEVLYTLDGGVEMPDIPRPAVEVVVEVGGVFAPDGVGDVGEPDVDALCAGQDFPETGR